MSDIKVLEEIYSNCNKLAIEILSLRKRIEELEKKFIDEE